MDGKLLFCGTTFMNVRSLIIYNLKTLNSRFEPTRFCICVLLLLINKDNVHRTTSIILNVRI